MNMLPSLFVTLGVAWAAVASAAVAPAAARVPKTRQTIVYEVGPCHGFCPVYRISVSANGRGVFTGIRNTRFVGQKSFRLTSRQYRHYAAGLAALRPRGERLLEDQTQCASFATDMSTIDVHWQDRRHPGHLRYNLGCDRATNAAIADALKAAPAMLPVAKLIGSR